MTMKNIALKFSFVVLLFTLSGCNDATVLFSGLSENDANDIIAELNQYHIDAHKQMDKTGIAVSIESSEIERSVKILDAVGLPHKARTNLGEVFQKNGVISSPLEERARYIYALSQEVESTLSQIDGVVTARVHVVLPERIAPGEPVQPASASVFIKYRTTLDPDSIEPRIRQLVSTSIPGLAGKTDRDLSIVFVPAMAYEDHTDIIQLGPFQLTPEEYNTVRWCFSGFIVLMLVIGFIFLRAGNKLKRLAKRTGLPAEK